MPTPDVPKAPFAFTETEPYVGEGPLLRTRRRRTMTALIIVLVVLVAVLAVTVPRLLWSQSLDLSMNERTGLADGAYVIVPTASMHDGDGCWFRGPVRGLPGADEVTVAGRGVIQCARLGEEVARVEVVVRDGAASITRVRNY